MKNYERILNELEQQGGKFTDAKFPPQTESYDENINEDESYGDIEWYRASKMPSFTDPDGKCIMDPLSASPMDFTKYISKNGFLISCLSVLAENP